MIRHTRSTRCPVCEGADGKRGIGERCWGYTSDDGVWVRCTRPEHAGPLPLEPKTSAYVHKIGGPCKCGVEHAPETNGHRQFDRIVVATYEYRDEQDKPLYRVLRYRPKSFSQQRWDEKANDWIGGEGCMEGVRSVPYRLQELLEAQKTCKRVYIVDGEKDVDTAWALGVPATCCKGGMVKWPEGFSKFITSKNVTVIADKDKGEGQKGAKIVSALLGDHAEICELPGEKVKDLTDWVEAGGSKDELEAIASHAIDWKKILDATPFPAKDLASFVGKPVPYIVKPIIVRGSLTQLQGTQKGGKSAFANYFALCASTGKWPNEHMQGGTHRVLYVSWEDPKLMMAQKLALYGKGMGLENFLPENLTYIFRPYFAVEKKEHFSALKQMVDDLKSEFVILDTLAHTHSCDENAASEMRPVMANLAALAEDKNIGIVYLHHIAKMAGDRTPQDKSRGSSAIAAAWHVLIDWGVREEGSNVNPVQIQSKFLHKFLKWDVEYIHDGKERENEEPTYVQWDIRSSDPAVASQAKQEKLREVYSIIEDFAAQRQSISRHDVADFMKVSPNTAKSYLLMMVSAGILMKTRVGTGRGNTNTYKLVPDRTPQKKGNLEG